MAKITDVLRCNLEQQLSTPGEYVQFDTYLGGNGLIHMR